VSEKYDQCQDPTVNVVERIAYHYSYQMRTTDDFFPHRVEFWYDKKHWFTINNNDYDGVDNIFNWIENHGHYQIFPKPESTTTLMTPYNIKARFVIADNLETHIANVNDIKGDVFILTNDVNFLQGEVDVLQKEVMELDDLVQMLNANMNQMTIMMIAGSIFEFGVSALNTISDVGIDLAEAGARIAFDAEEDSFTLETDKFSGEGLSIRRRTTDNPSSINVSNDDGTS
jgi:hypothetical protein